MSSNGCGDQLHDELMLAIRSYFEANQKWASNGHKRNAIKLRHELSNIRRICSEQRIVVRDWMDEYEFVLKDKLETRKLQNHIQDQQDPVDTDNN
jgi:hypothetical protein